MKMQLINYLNNSSQCATTDVKGLSKKIKSRDLVKNFNILMANIRSIRGGFEELTSMLDAIDHHFSIIILNEVWLDPGDEHHFAIDNYDLYSNCRNRNGGGVMIYCSRLIQSRCLSDLDIMSPIMESLFIEIKLQSQTLIIGTIYRPPGCSVREFSLLLQTKILSQLSTDNLLICGDLNINLLSEISNANKTFADIMIDNNLMNVVTEITRETDNTASILDHIWTSLPEIPYSFVIGHKLSDHYPIGCSIVLHDETKTRQISFRKCTNGRIRRFHDEFSQFASGFNIERDKHPNILFRKLIHKLIELINKYFPIVTKTVKLKSIKSPWIDKELHSLIEKKYSIYRKCKIGLLPFNTYRAYRNKLTKTIKLAKKIYYEKQFMGDLSSVTIWNRINKLRKPCKPVAPMEIIENNVVFIDPQEVSKIGNIYFKNSVLELSKNKTVNPNQTNFNKSIPSNPKSFFMAPTTPSEIEKIIKSLNENNFKRSEIPTRLLKEISKPLANILSPLINICFEQSVFPDILKVSELTPHYKKGNRKHICNYRPITKSNPITKIFEYLIYYRLDSFFVQCDLISKPQFGFQKGKSIEGAVVNLLNEINEANSKNSSTAAVFIDLSKAFDCINHSLLLEKLERYGVRGLPLKFIESYFTNRYQYTRVENSKSETVPVTTGVPQGSALGPLFFAIYINDIVKVIKYTKVFIYADDVVLVDSNSNPLNIKLNLENDLSNITNYFEFNDLYINHSKTKWMLFTRNTNVTFQIEINGVPIERTEEFTYLGLVIDSKLTFSNHILKLSKRINGINGSLYFLKFKLPEFILIKLFYALVYPHMHLHILAWGGATESSLNPIIISVNKTIRNICHHELHTDEKYLHHNIPTIRNLYKMKVGEFMYKTFKMNKSPLLEDIIPKFEFSHSYGTRKSTLRVPKITTNTNKRFFLYSGVQIWNDLSEFVKNSPSLNIFKKLLREFLEAKDKLS